VIPGLKAEPLISFRNVQKTYDGVNLIVRDLNLDIERGEFLTLLGPSGSGKTTCLTMLAGFETPTAGEIRLAGQVINRVPPHQRNIGMVFQNYALFPHLTVKENLRFPLTVRKLPAVEIDAKVDKALSMVRMDGFGNRYPQQMSGGNNGSRLRGRWCSIHSSSSWTSRWARSTSSCASTCRSRSSISTGRWA
jgi:putative spermidine/putrescine transport system ATP-binding protein